MNLNFFLSDDIFISYSRWDASTYAPGLADKLIQAGFSCFIDRYGTDPNRDLPDTLKAKIRSCRMFVLVATRRAAISEAVEKEIIEFQRTGRASRIVPIDVDGSLRDARWLGLIEGIAPEPERNVSALDDGNPSDAVVSRIEKSFSYMRGKERLRRATIAAGVALVALLLAGAGASAYALSQVRVASAARADAESARTDANTQRRAATQAETLRDAANAARDAAARQRAEAEVRRDQAQAEATRQEVIAASGRQATYSRVLLAQQPISLVRSVSAALDSMSKAASVQAEAVGADSALRDSIALLPRYLGGKTLSSDRLVLSPDGRHFAVVASDQLFVVSAADPDRPIGEVPHSGSFEIALSRDGEFVAQEQGGVVRIFDVRRKTSWEVPIKKGGGEFISLALSPKGKYLAAVYRDRGAAGREENSDVLARLFDARSGEIVLNLTRSTGIRPNDVAFGPNGNLAIAGRLRNVFKSGGAVAMWYLADGRGADWEDFEVQEVGTRTAQHEQDGEVMTVAPGLTMSSFATISSEQTILWRLVGNGRYEPSAYVPLNEVAGDGRSYVEDLSFTADGSRLAVVRDISGPTRRTAKAVEEWETTGYRESTRVSHGSQIYQVGFRPNGNAVAVANRSGFLGAGVYAPVGAAEERESEMGGGAADPAYTTQSSDARVALAGRGSVWELWDFMRGTKRRVLIHRDPGIVANLAASLDRTHIAVAWQNAATLAVYALKENAYREIGRIALQRPPLDVAVTPDGDVIVLNANRTLEVRSVKTSRDLTPMALRGRNDVDSVKLGPRGRRFVTIRRTKPKSTESLIQVWNIRDGRDVKSFQHASSATVVEFSPSGRFVLTAGDDYEMHLLDLNASHLTSLNTDARLLAGAFSSDERYYATGSVDGVLRVMLTASPETEVTRMQHDTGVTKIAFSEGNKYVATGSGSQLRVFALRSQDLIQEASARLRSLSTTVRRDR